MEESTGLYKTNAGGKEMGNRERLHVHTYQNSFEGVKESEEDRD